MNASQRVDLVVFGRKAKKLAQDLGVAPDNLRDALTPKELPLLQEVEDTAVRLIDLRDVHQKTRRKPLALDTGRKSAAVSTAFNISLHN